MLRSNNATDGQGMSTIEWTNANGGDWSVAGNWSTDSVPGAADDVTIGVAGPYTVTIDSAEAVHSLTLNDAGTRVQINNALTLGTTLYLTAGSFDLKSGGTLVGGTVVGSGMVFAGGTLVGVTFDGTLDLSATGAKAHVSNGITLTGTDGSGPGELLLTGYNSELYFGGTQVLDNAYVGIGGKYSYDILVATSAGGTLSLGPELTIGQVGNYAELSVTTGAAIVNNGTIDAGASGGHFLISGNGSFTNLGTLSVANGDQMVINQGVAFSNQGTIDVANGDQMVINQGVAFSNQGTITLGAGSGLTLKDNLSTAALGSLTNSGGTLSIVGTLNNTGAVLATGTGGLGTVTFGSKTINSYIIGGTITGSEMSFTGVMRLSGVTYDGTMDLSDAGLEILNGITLAGADGTGPATILMTGYPSGLVFQGTQTFDNAVVTIGGTASSPEITAEYGTTLTVGPNLTISQIGSSTAGFYVQGEAAIVNSGTIDVNGAMGAGGPPRHDGPSATFINEGMIDIANGGNFEISNALYLYNSGTISIANGAALTFDSSGISASALGNVINSGGEIVLLGATLNNTANVLMTGSSSSLGTVALYENGTILRGTVTGSGMRFGGGALSGVTYVGSLDLSAGSVTITNGITLTGPGGNGPGSVVLTSGELVFAGNQTFDNASVSIGGSAGFGGSLEGASGGTLTLGSHLMITQVGPSADFGSYDGEIVSNVVIDADVSGGVFALEPGLLFSNMSIISVSNGESLTSGSYLPRQGPRPATVTGNGTITLANGGAASLVGPVGAGQVFDFLDATAQLSVTAPENYAFNATIDGFRPGNTIDLMLFSFISAATATMGPDNVLQVSAFGSQVDFQFDPTQNFAGYFFHLSSNGPNGTLITEDQNPCFLRATMILTPAGDVAVEALAIGDLVTTAAGEARPIKWIGRRSYAARFALGQRQILPVCIKAGALADGLPKRDLWLSPNHALYLEGVLIEARDLINGASVVQPQEVDVIEYFHVELDTHDLLIAEGAAAESYIDDDNRLLFHNAAEYRTLCRDQDARPVRYCAPRLAEGYQVERARALLARRASLPVPAEEADSAAADRLASVRSGR
jgi:fibronectin-binding autotransporter adhesin